MITYYKFRGKQHKTGEWLVGDLIHFRHDVMILPLDADWFDFVPRKNNPFRLPSDRFVVDPETVGQFTGLQDEDGHDIYEGDIIKDGVLFHQILWIDEASAFSRCNLKDADIRTRISRDSARYVKVIGNIHDDKNLLEKGGKK